MDRRNFLNGALKLGAAACATPMVARAQVSRPLSFVSWGGSYGDIAKEFWIKPFTAETGIPVEYVTGPDLARVRAQVQSKTILWDVVDIATPAFVGAKEGLWETIDPKIVDYARFINTPPPFVIWTNSYATGIAYDSKTGRALKDFSEFLDVKNLPGRRALGGTSGVETLEFALLADGVPPNKIYPLDVDRALKVLTPLKSIIRWTKTTPEPIQLLQRKEVDYALTSQARVRPAHDSGVPIDFSFGQCIIGSTACTVVKGTPHKEAAMRFVDFVTRPQQQVALANRMGVLPVVKGVADKVDANTRRWFPDVNSPKHLFLSNEYWGEHRPVVEKRFVEWLLT